MSNFLHSIPSSIVGNVQYTTMQTAICHCITLNVHQQSDHRVTYLSRISEKHTPAKITTTSNTWPAGQKISWVL